MRPRAPFEPLSPEVATHCAGSTVWDRYRCSASAMEPRREQADGEQRHRGRSWRSRWSRWCLLAAGPAAADGCPRTPGPGDPAAARGRAMTGSGFVRATAALSEAEREPVIAGAAARGRPAGVPPASQTGHAAGRTGGRAVRVTICVTPDYLALGSDEDFLRIPMALPTALAVAEPLRLRAADPQDGRCDLPAGGRASAAATAAGSDRMRSTAYYWRHDQRDPRAAPGARRRRSACWSRATRRTSCSPTGSSRSPAGSRSTAGTAATAIRSSRSARSTAPATPTTATASAWSVPTAYVDGQPTPIVDSGGPAARGPC